MHPLHSSSRGLTQIAIVILAVVATAVVVGGGVFLVMRSTAPTTTSSPLPTPTPTSSPAASVILSANEKTISRGGAVTLTWSAVGVESCTAGDESGEGLAGWSGEIGISGSRQIQNIQHDYIFSVSCIRSKNSSAPDAFSEVRVNVVDTTQWKTYRNGTYGFEVKYPPNWTIWHQTDTGANIANPNNSNQEAMSIAVYDNDPEGSIRDINQIYTTSAVTIQGAAGKKLVGESGVTGKSTVILILKKQTNYYTVDVPADIAGQVIASFTFTK